MLEYVGIKANMAETKQSNASEPKVPAYAGGRLPLSQNWQRQFVISQVMRHNGNICRKMSPVAILQKRRSGLAYA